MRTEHHKTVTPKSKATKMYDKQCTKLYFGASGVRGGLMIAPSIFFIFIARHINLESQQKYMRLEYVNDEA